MKARDMEAETKKGARRRVNDREEGNTSEQRANILETKLREEIPSQMEVAPQHTQKL